MTPASWHEATKPGGGGVIAFLGLVLFLGSLAGDGPAL